MRRLLSIAWIVSGALGWGCAQAPAPGDAKRDIVLITVDTLRWDATGFSGAGKAKTPTMDRLAAEGRVFTNSHAHAVVTLPSHASILTGLLPFEHEVRDNSGFVVSPGIPTLASIVAERGYRTGAFVSAFPLDRRFGLARGFEHYDDEYEGASASAFTYPERSGEETIERGLAWWRGQAGAPRFLWVHLYTPHFPYTPPEPWASRHPDRPYYGEAEHADAQLGPLVAALLDEASTPPIVILTSDHGEALGEHGEDTHGLFAYESTLKVPLVICAPGLVSPGRDAGPASHIDIVPSILDLVGIDSPATLSGRSLLDEAHRGERAVYFEALSAHLNRGWAPLVGSLENGLKVIDLPIPELYDLAADPDERRNLAVERADSLASRLAAIPSAARDPIEVDRVDPDVAARLRSLGYLSGGSSVRSVATADDDAALDPKNLVGIDRRLHRALTLWTAGDGANAAATLETLLHEQPRLAVAYGYLSYIYSSLGRTREAAALLKRARAAGADTEEIRRKLALSQLALGELEDASLTLARDSESVDPETQAALGRIAAALGRSEEAHARFSRAEQLDSTFPEASIDRAILLMMEGRLTDALPLLEQGLARDPAHAEGWNALGVVRSRQGNLSGAIEAWSRAIDADPFLSDALYNLGTTLAQSGDTARAIPLLERYASLVGDGERERVLSLVSRLRSQTSAR